jgi:hypothetical protein
VGRRASVFFFQKKIKFGLSDLICSALLIVHHLDFLLFFDPLPAAVSPEANIMDYPRDSKCTGTEIEAVFSTMVEAKVQEIGFWANRSDGG